MRKVLGKVVFVIIGVCIGAGCASTPVVVEPTLEEMRAAKEYKKTVAVLEFTDNGSPVEGIQSVVLSKLENMLVGHFNVVERTRIDEVFAERDFSQSDEVERMAELGKFLGADYLMFGNVIASATSDQVKSQSYKDKDGKFSGSIWEESCADAEVSLKIVDVSSGMVVYSDKKSASQCAKDASVSYNNEAMFSQDLQRQKSAAQFIKIVGNFRTLEKEYSFIVANALERAVGSFNYDLKNKFAQSGEVIEISSNKEVVINLGSAFGIKPGDIFIVWEEKAPVKDPRTGIITVPKEKKGTLRVKKVTSGLTCVAMGSAGLIAAIRVGDIVYTH